MHAKVHPDILEQAEWGDHGCLIDVFCQHGNLTISLLSVQLAAAEPGCQVIHPWEAVFFKSGLGSSMHGQVQAGKSGCHWPASGGG